VRVTFDPAKDAANRAERGLPFDQVAELHWESALLVEDQRRDYGEIRVRVMAQLRGRLHMAVITMRGDAVHVISFRKANRKEVAWYEQGRR
jgi:uncharacterized DUF497 family protein